jgi:hypothetical protein
MMDTAGTPKNYWSYALKAAFYLKNRCLHAALETTPFEVMFKSQPDISNLRVFGCISYVYVERDRKKLDERARPSIFLGYDTNSKTYIVGTPNGFGCIRPSISRSVTFDEDRFYFKQPHEVSTVPLSVNLPPVLQDDADSGVEESRHYPDDADNEDSGDSGGTLTNTPPVAHAPAEATDAPVATPAQPE